VSGVLPTRTLRRAILAGVGLGGELHRRAHRQRGGRWRRGSAD